MVYFLIPLCVAALTSPGGDVAKPKPGEEVEPVKVQMVVTAQFRPESARDTPVEVTVLDEEDMRGDRDLRELLSTELQLDLQQHSVFGSSLSVDGVSHDNVKILINGMPVLGRLDGIIDLEQIDLSAFERVEILKGSGSVYYGTDALGGVVNLIPRAGDGPPELLVKGHYRDIGDAQQTAKAGFSLGKHGFELTFTRRHFDGEDQTPDTRRGEWRERLQKSGGLNWGRPIGAVKLSGFVTTSDEELADLGEFADGFAWDQRYETRRNSAQFSVDGAHGDDLSYNLFVGFADYDRKRISYQSFQDDAVETPSEQVVDPEFNNAFKMLAFKGMISKRNLFANVDGQIGLDWNLEEGSGGRILDGSAEMENRAVFGGLRWQTPFGLVVQPMARVMDNDVFDVPTTPSLHLKYTAKRGLVWRGSYSRGFRGPSIKQLFLDFNINAGPFRYHITGNEDLQAEEGDHYETSLATPIWLGEASSLHLKTRLFYNDIEDLIALSALAPDPQTPNLFVRHYINVNEHRGRGGELNLSGAFSWFDLELGLSRIETLNALSKDNPLPEYNGRWDGRAQISRRMGGHQLELVLKHVGRQPGFVEVSAGRGAPVVVEEVTTSSYDRIDLSWHYQRSESSWRLGAGVKNLADVRERDALILSNGLSHAVNQVDWGRTFQVELGWRWSGRE